MSSQTICPKASHTHLVHYPMSACLKQRPDSATADLGVEDGRPALAFFDFLARELAVGQIVVLSYFIRQPFVDECIASKPEFLAPSPVFELVFQNVFQSHG